MKVGQTLDLDNATRAVIGDGRADRAKLSSRQMISWAASFGNAGKRVSALAMQHERGPSRHQHWWSAATSSRPLPGQPPASSVPAVQRSTWSPRSSRRSSTRHDQEPGGQRQLPTNACPRHEGVKDFSATALDGNADGSTVPNDPRRSRSTTVVQSTGLLVRRRARPDGLRTKEASRGPEASTSGPRDAPEHVGFAAAQAGRHVPLAAPPSRLAWPCVSGCRCVSSALSRRSVFRTLTTSTPAQLLTPFCMAASPTARSRNSRRRGPS